MNAVAAPSRPPSVLRMAAPLVVSFVMRSLFTFVDTIYASFLGDASVAAIGLTIPFEFLMIAVWVGVSNGLTSTLSRAMGAREGERIDSLLRATRVMSLALVPVFAAVGVAIWFSAPRIGLEPHLAREFQIYGSVLLGGSAFTMFWSIIPDSVVKAHQDTRATMWAGIWSNVINVVLNTIFTFVFHWGIFGIALSTVIGRFGGLAYALSRAGAYEAKRRAAGTDTVPGADPHPYRAILALGIPAAFSYGLMAAEGQVINEILRRLPDATASIAAYSIYYRVLMFAIMPAIATSVAMLPFAARRFGEGDFPGLRRALREGLGAGAAYVVLILVPTLWLAGPAIARSLANADLTRQYTEVMLLLCPLACFVSLPFFMCRPVFEGMQRGQPGMWVALLRYVVLTVPLGIGGVRLAVRLGHPGIYGLAIGLMAATAVASAVMLLWLLAAMRRLPAQAGEGQAPAPALERVLD